MMKQFPMLCAETIVSVSVDQARQWFLDLGTHPERYAFETHAGFAFTQGDFGRPQSRFVSWEYFYGVKVSLGFELIEVGHSHLRFRLLRPPLPIWGAFVLEDAGGRATKVTLQIGGTARLGEWFLSCPLFRGAIERQIRGEVGHIKASMEALHTSDRS
jgi:hypothetical protein